MKSENVEYLREAADLFESLERLLVPDNPGLRLLEAIRAELQMQGFNHVQTEELVSCMDMQISEIDLEHEQTRRVVQALGRVCRKAVDLLGYAVAIKKLNFKVKF